MKRFFQFGTILLTLVALTLTGVLLYFNDARLKSFVVPQLNEALGRPVQIDRISLQLIRTFPDVGLAVEGVVLPDDQGKAFLSLHELLVSVHLTPLLSNKLEVTEVVLHSPVIHYVIDKEGRSNIDGLLAHVSGEASTEEHSSDEDESGSTMQVDLELFRLIEGQIKFIDEQNGTTVQIDNLNGTTSVQLGDVIESVLNLRIGGLSVSVNNERMIDNLPLQLNQTSVINLNEERISLTKGGFAIKGLGLDVKGEITQAFQNHPHIALTVSSSAEDLGALLTLVPASMADKIVGLQTKGKMNVRAEINGALFQEALPAFSAEVMLENGYIKNPDTPEPIEDIQLRVTVTNEKMEISTFSAKAAGNIIQAKAQIQGPLSDAPVFDASFNASVALGTVHRFLDLKAFDVEQLNGTVQLQGTGKGNVNEPEQAAFNVQINIAQGYLKHTLTESPVENIHVELNATNTLVNLARVEAISAGNRIHIKGTVNDPLEEKKTRFALQTALSVDLSSIKKFYPIDEDTLLLRGKLSSDVRIQGWVSKPEEVKAHGELRLQQAYVKHKVIPVPLEEIGLPAVFKDNTIDLKNAFISFGKNKAELNGIIRNYLTESPDVNMKVKASLALDEMHTLLELKPYVHTLSGSATSDLIVKGPAMQPEKLSFNGGLMLRNVHAEGDSLPQPIRDLSVNLTFSNQDVTLSSLRMNLGSSDIALHGQLKDYMVLLEEKPKKTAALQGTYKSRFLHVDELLKWTESTSSAEQTEPTLIELPSVTTTLTATVDSLLLLGVPMVRMNASMNSTPTSVAFTNASVGVAGGEIKGKMLLDILRPERSRMQFDGSVDSVLFQVFFKEYQMMGKSTLHENVSGSFSAKATFNAEIDSLLVPDIKTIQAQGNFGMTKSRIKDHPAQQSIASFLGAPELRNMALDDWKATFVIKEGILTLSDMNLTSGDIGMSLNGTSDLVQERINMKARLFLPGRYGDKLASIITRDAVEALRQDNGTIMVPMVLRGATQSPSVNIDQDVLKPIIERYLKRKVGGALRNLIGG